MKILIVDDNKENLYILDVLLRGSGYEVESAADGVEALEKATHGSFDMIISDILMPRMDGFQLCREIKKEERTKQIVFVFYTATYTDPKDEELALNLGAEKFIVKPAEPDVFIETIKEIAKAREKGILTAQEPPLKEDETVYLKKYNERLIKKLEDKILQLGRANKALQTSEQKCRDLLDNANDAIIVIEPTGYLGFVNPKFCDMMGYSVEEAKGLHFSRLVHSDDLAMVQERFSNWLSGKEVSWNYEARCLTKNGNTIYTDINASTIEKEGKITGAQIIIRDITKRKQAEAEKKRLEAQLIQAQKMKAIGTLAGGVAHDFNNLLTSIQGYTDLAMMDLDMDNPGYSHLKEVRRASVRAANLTRQLLLFSRRQPIEMTPVNLNHTIEDMIKMVRRLIGEDISIVTDLEEELWTINADPGNIEQVIMNLVVNARDAMPEGGKITIRTENARLDEVDCKLTSDARPGNFVCLSITDTGTGMDKKTIERIFEPFFTTKELGKGTGLGLSVVYGIIKQHKGWINVSSEPGRGCKFRIYLPSVSTKPERTEEYRVSPVKFRGKGERILLVEDEQAVRKLNTETLDRNGYAIFPASNAKEALDIFERENGDFALVFSGVVLPDKNGLELIDEILSHKPDLHVLLTSGYSDEKSLWQAIHERGFRFLQKPYSLDHLLRAIREALEKK